MCIRHAQADTFVVLLLAALLQRLCRGVAACMRLAYESILYSSLLNVRLSELPIMAIAYCQVYGTLRLPTPWRHHNRAALINSLPLP